MSQAIAADQKNESQQHTKTGNLTGYKMWLGRISFLLLFVLLTIFMLLGKDVYYKYLILRAAGIDAGVNLSSQVILNPLNSQLAAQVGIQEGDILQSVNGKIIDPSIPIQKAIQELSFSGSDHLVLQVFRTNSTTHQVDINLTAPRADLFNLSIMQVTRYMLLLDLLLVVGFLMPTMIIFLRKSDDKLGLFVAFTLLLTAFRFLRVNLFVFNMIASLLIFLLYSIARILLLIFLFIFPDGHFVPRWSKYFVLFGVLWVGLSIFFPIFYGPSGQFIDLVIFAIGLWAQIYRYRRVSNLRERQQTKWIILGLVIACVVGYSLALIQFLPALRDSGTAYMQFQLLGQLLLVLSLLAMPFTVSISIHRYHLYDIDTVINRALVYGALTAIISGLVVALTGFFQRLFMSLTGEKTEVIIVITTLIVASLMTPIKTYIQTVVDQHFKSAPNPQKQLEAFIERINGRLSPVEVRQIIRRLLDESVAAFEASGGTVIPVPSAPTFGQITKSWDGDLQIKVPIQSNGKSYGFLALGKRNNGAEYTPHDHDILQSAAQQTAKAIIEDEQI